MKKISYLLIYLFIILINITVYAEEKQTYSRNELQNFVVNTAFSYLYNNNYSNYEQHSMDSSQKDENNKTIYYSSINYRNISISPESVNRTNEFNIDCSSFANMVYLYSIGYDMSEYLNDFSSSRYYENFKLINNKSSYDNYVKGYMYYGKGWSTNNISRIAAKSFTGNYDIAKNVTTNHESYKNTNNNNNNNSPIYYYKVDLDKENNYKYNESLDDIKRIREEILDILEPGDVLVYRRYRKNQNDYTGHAILYIGDALNNDEHGFIHSTGKDFDTSTTPITLGEDEFSIRYDTWENRFEENIFVGVHLNTGKDYSKTNNIVTYSISIIRPINTYCNENNCTANISDNTLARNKLANLQIEQYIKNNEKLISKYNSINTNENITYTLELTNNSVFDYCTYGNYGNKTECINEGYLWKTTEKNKKSYDNITLESIIPDGTTFVECSNNCAVDGNNIMWKNISISPAKKNTYTYTVSVSSKKDIINNGIKIKYDDVTLTMEELNIKVNNTLNENHNKNIVNDTINNITNLVKQNKIKLSKTENNNYNIKLSDITNETMSQLDFVKSIYYNSLNIDMGNFSIEDIKTALFNKSTDKIVYAKKTDEQISNLSDKTFIKINKMLVKGIYGGKILKGNDNKDRITYLSEDYLEYGDLVITYNKSTTDLSNVYVYLGNDANNKPIIMEFTENNGNSEITIYDANETDGISGYRIIKEVFAQDLFAVLRPSQLLEEKDSNSTNTEEIEKESDNKNNTEEKDMQIENPKTGVVSIISIIFIGIISLCMLIYIKKKKLLFKI